MLLKKHESPRRLGKRNDHAKKNGAAVRRQKKQTQALRAKLRGMG